MNPARLQQLLNGQSAIAQKVYSALPVNNSLSIQEIYLLVRRGGKTTADKRTVEACVYQLERAGLFIKADNGNFRKARVTVDIRPTKQTTSAAPAPVAAQEPVVETKPVETKIENPTSMLTPDVLKKTWRRSLINRSTTTYNGMEAKEKAVVLKIAKGKKVDYSLINAAQPGDVFRVRVDPKTDIHELMTRFRYIRNRYSPACGYLLELHIFDTYVDLYVTDIPCGPQERPDSGTTVTTYGSMVNRLALQGMTPVFKDPVVTDEKVTLGNVPAFGEVKKAEAPSAPAETAAAAAAEENDIGPGEHLDYWKQLVLACVARGDIAVTAMAEADAVIARLRTFK